MFMRIYSHALFFVCVQADVSRCSVLSVSLGSTSTGTKIQLVFYAY